VAHSGLRLEHIIIPRGGAFSGRQGGFASADLFDFEKLLSLTSKHFSYDNSALAGCYCLSIEFIVLILYLCSTVSFTSLFPLYPVQCKFAPSYSGDGNVNSHSAF